MWDTVRKAAIKAACNDAVRLYAQIVIRYRKALERAHARQVKDAENRRLGLPRESSLDLGMDGGKRAGEEAQQVRALPPKLGQLTSASFRRAEIQSFYDDAQQDKTGAAFGK